MSKLHIYNGSIHFSGSPSLSVHHALFWIRTGLPLSPLREYCVTHSLRVCPGCASVNTMLQMWGFLSGLDCFQDFARRLSGSIFFNCAYLLFSFWAFLILYDLGPPTQEAVSLDLSLKHL